MVVNPDEAWNFAYVLPRLSDDEEIQLVIPDALQMGWSESPPFFCAATETARDIADANFRNDTPMEPQHNEDIVMKTIPASSTDDVEAKIIHLLEIYIDDFVAMINTQDEKELRRLTRCILKGITDVFP